MNRAMTSKFARSPNTNLAQTLFRTTTHTTTEVEDFGLGATVSSQLLYRGDRDYDCDGAELPIPSGHHPPSSRSQNLAAEARLRTGTQTKNDKGRGKKKKKSLGRVPGPPTCQPAAPARCAACPGSRFLRPLKPSYGLRARASACPRANPAVCPTPAPPPPRQKREGCSACAEVPRKNK